MGSVMGAGFGFGGSQLPSTCNDRAEILARTMSWKWMNCCVKPPIKPVSLRLQLVYWLIVVSRQVLPLWSGTKQVFFASSASRPIVAKLTERIVVVWGETIGFPTQKHHQISFCINRMVVALRLGLVVALMPSNHPSPASQRCHYHLNPSIVARKAVRHFKPHPHGTKCSSIHPRGRWSGRCWPEGSNEGSSHH